MTLIISIPLWCRKYREFGMGMEKSRILEAVLFDNDGFFQQMGEGKMDSAEKAR